MIHEVRLLLSWAAQRSLLLMARANGLKTGRFRDEAEADDFLVDEDRRYDEQIRTLLEDQYADFWKATEQLKINLQLEAFSRTLERENASLQPEDIDDLSDIYWAEYKRGGVQMLYSANYSKFASGEALGVELQKRTAANERALKVAATFLTPQQTEKLKVWEDNQLKGMLMFARVARKPSQ